MRCALPAALAGHQTGPDEDQVGMGEDNYHFKWRGQTYDEHP